MNDATNTLTPALVTAGNYSIKEAARLVSKALQASLNPSNDLEYRDLLATYRSEPQFRNWVSEITTGLDLTVLDVSERGLFIAPSGPASRFAYRLGDFRSSMNEGEKSALVLAHIAIASVFFPTTDSIDNDDHLVNPASVAQLRDALLNMAASLGARADEHSEQSIDLEMIQPGWHLIKGLPVSLPKAQKASTSSVVGLIKIALNNLKEAGMVRLHLEAQEETMETYTPTHRYRVQLRELTLRKLLEIAREANQGKQ
jgi:hypothetical protein